MKHTYFEHIFNISAIFLAMMVAQGLVLKVLHFRSYFNTGFLKFFLFLWKKLNFTIHLFDYFNKWKQERGEERGDGIKMSVNMLEMNYFSFHDLAVLFTILSLIHRLLKGEIPVLPIAVLNLGLNLNQKKKSKERPLHWNSWYENCTSVNLSMLSCVLLGNRKNQFLCFSYQKA